MASHDISPSEGRATDADGLAVSLVLGADQVEAIARRVAEIVDARAAPRRVPAPALTVRQAAEALAVSPKTIYRAVADGRLPAERIGRAVRISADDLRGLHPGARSSVPIRRQRAPGEPDRDFYALGRGR
jgi:excisionase family DNA binding protein